MIFKKVVKNILWLKRLKHKLLAISQMKMLGHKQKYI